ncbi:MAG: hypothetical protein H0U74_12130 [Bradymonadaceae bacterium]|nr:hypothetical protein [Lujinxingiaceae bacterium]
MRRIVLVLFLLMFVAACSQDADVSPPDTGEADVLESDANKADVSESDANEADVLAPDANEPDANECVPNCEGRTCGLDPLCDVSCGTCEGSCSDEGVCELFECNQECVGESCELVTASLPGGFLVAGSLAGDAPVFAPIVSFTRVDGLGKVTVYVIDYQTSLDYVVRLLPGTYDAQAVLGTRIQTERIEVGQDMRLDFDFAADVSVALSGAVSWEGATIPSLDPALPDWRLHFKDTTSGRQITVHGFGGQDDYEVRVIPGTYDIQFCFEHQPADLDAGWCTPVATAFELVADATLDLHLAAVELALTIRLDGAALPVREPLVAQISLSPPLGGGNGGLLQIRGGEERITARVLAHTYSARLEIHCEALGSERCMGSTILVHDYDLGAEPDLGEFELSTAEVELSVRWNGAALAGARRLVFYDLASGISIRSLTLAQLEETLALKVLTGTYGASVETTYVAGLAGQTGPNYNFWQPYLPSVPRCFDASPRAIALGHEHHHRLADVELTADGVVELSPQYVMVTGSLEALNLAPGGELRLVFEEASGKC